jgi:geranylgeranyl diphosphate synthase type I
MLDKIKTKIDGELIQFIEKIDRLYSLSSISELLYKSIKDFVLRDGKRVRPILFCAGYLGFSKRIPSGLYSSALSFELLHDFMLVHDDIIDKSDTRRGKPAMHTLLDTHLKKYANVKFNGSDLAIVAGDILYAMAIQTFLMIKEEPKRKEKALKKFIDAALYTGSGEFIELLYTIRKMEDINKNVIYKIYDYKTAFYTFASPLAIGAILAGASDHSVDKLFRYGVYLGRAFQIKDDLLGIFGEEHKTGKSSLTDIKEAKKTLLVWHAYNHNTAQNKKRLENIFAKETVTHQDLVDIRKIIVRSGTFEYAKNEVMSFLKKSKRLLKESQIKEGFRYELYRYSQSVLEL